MARRHERAVHFCHDRAQQALHTQRQNHEALQRSTSMEIC
jgi:hypothetical protein